MLLGLSQLPLLRLHHCQLHKIELTAAEIDALISDIETVAAPSKEELSPVSESGEHDVKDGIVTRLERHFQQYPHDENPGSAKDIVVYAFGGSLNDEPLYSNVMQRIKARASLVSYYVIPNGWLCAKASCLSFVFIIASCITF